MEDLRSKALSETAVELLYDGPERTASRTPLVSTTNFADPPANASFFQKSVSSGAIAKMLSMAPTYSAVPNRMDEAFEEADI